MSIVPPSSGDDFRSAAYWEQSFAASRAKLGEYAAFEWYAEFPQVAANLSVALSAAVSGTGRQPRVLVIGCGDSALSAALAQPPLSCAVVSVDRDVGVIEHMRATSGGVPGAPVWCVADARDLRRGGGEAAALCGDGVFDAVIDKGTLDAMAGAPGEGSLSSVAEAAADVDAMLAEVVRVLAPGGVHVIISLAQAHVLARWVRHVLVPHGAWVAAHVDTPAKHDLVSQRCPFVLSCVRAGAAAPVAAAASATPPIFVHCASSFEQVSDDVTLSALPVVSAAANSVVAWPCVHASGESVRPVTLDAGGESPALLLAEVDQVQWAYAAARTISAVQAGARLAVDVWTADGGGDVVISPAGGRAPGSESAGESGNSSAVKTPRFSITLVDASASQTAAVLLVPQGREHEWMFASAEGQRQVAQSAPMYGRLLFVSLGRGHSFPGGLPAVQAELSPIVARFLPPRLRPAPQRGSAAPAATGGRQPAPSAAPAVAALVPYLAVADDIGSRDVLEQGTNATSGGYVVEDVEVDEDDDDEAARGGGRGRRRRLIFLSNRNAVQSEAALCRASARGRATAAAAKVDTGRLCFEYQQAMAAMIYAYCVTAGAGRGDAVEATAPSAPLRVCVLGLGSGALASFLTAMPPAAYMRASRGAFSHAEVDAVELDADVVALARRHFGFVMHRFARVDAGAAAPTWVELRPPSATDGSTADAAVRAATAGDAAAQPTNRMSVLVGDGLAYIGSPAAAAAAYDILVVDVDTKDLSTAVAFPPAAFIAPEALARMRAALAPSGLLLINFSCRSPSLHASVLSELARAFGGSGGGSALQVALQADDSDANNSLIGACADGGRRAAILLAAAQPPAAAAPTAMVKDLAVADALRAERYWLAYAAEWGTLAAPADSENSSR